MRMDGRFFDDLARVASGALGAFGGVREQMEAQLRAPLERMVRQLDLVSREEFEAVQLMASRARQEQETLAERVAVLERRIADMARPPADSSDPPAVQGGASTPPRRARARPRTAPPKPLPPDQE